MVRYLYKEWKIKFQGFIATKQKEKEDNKEEANEDNKEVSRVEA